VGTVSFALSDLGRSNSRYFFSSKFPKSCYKIKVYLNYYPSPLFISAWIFERKYGLDFQVLKSNWKRDKLFSQLSKHCIVCPLIYGFWLPLGIFKKGTPLKNGDGLVFDRVPVTCTIKKSISLCYRQNLM